MKYTIIVLLLLVSCTVELSSEQIAYEEERDFWPGATATEPLRIQPSQVNIGPNEKRSGELFVYNINHGDEECDISFKQLGGDISISFKTEEVVLRSDYGLITVEWTATTGQTTDEKGLFLATLDCETFSAEEQFFVETKY